MHGLGAATTRERDFGLAVLDLTFYVGSGHGHYTRGRHVSDEVTSDMCSSSSSLWAMQISSMLM